MNVVDFAVAYVAERGLAQTPVYSARRFERMMGNLPISDITEATLVEWRRKSEEAGLSVWTVKCGLKDIRTLIRANGSDIRIARIKNPEPNPNPVSLDRLDAIWPHLATWSRQWLVIAFWTALRFADTVRMQRVVEPTKLEWKASKTKHRHRWPVMAWMQPHLQPVKLPYTKSEDWSEVIVRGELTRVCKLAGVDRILPSEVRDAALRAWCQADARVGEIVHGCRLGVIGHYVDPLDIIQPVAGRVKVPSCFGANETNSEDLTLAISKLDPDARRMVTEMAYRLAR
jgi:hypothetical protein